MSCMQSFSLVVNDVTLYVATLNLCFFLLLLMALLTILTVCIAVQSENFDPARD